MKYEMEINPEGEKILDDIIGDIKARIESAKKEKAEKKTGRNYDDLIKGLESVATKDKWIKAMIRDTLGRYWAQEKMTAKQKELKMQENQQELMKYNQELRDEFLKLIEVK